MKPVVNKRKCPAQPMVCTAIKNCSTGALSYVDDENEPLGGLIVINYDLCEECGTCSKVCCGSAIDLQ